MSRCILVVDDDLDILEWTSIVLKSAGYGVLTATDGKAALDRLRDGATPSLILLDLMMPGMNGWQFLDELHREPSLTTIPVVIVSGGSYREKEIKSLGVAGYLKKPFDASKLLATVEQSRTGADRRGPLPEGTLDRHS
jgi:CheY-like chemotaxis protein